jgi:hypothetical protein
VRKARRKREEGRITAAAPKIDSYREQQFRELLEISRIPEAKLSVSQVEALLSWQGTTAGDVRRLVAMLEPDQRLIALRKAAGQHGAEAA